MNTEFVLKNIVGGKAHVQVKQGYVDLNRDYYAQIHGESCDWYLFTTNGEYYGGEHVHVHCLSPDDMKNFALDNRHLMSSRVQIFIDYVDN